MAKKGAWWCAVVDGRPGPKYQYRNDNGLIFHADGVLEYLGIRNGELYRVKQLPPN